MLGTREYTLCSPFRENAHNSSCYMFSISCSVSLVIGATVLFYNNDPNIGVMSVFCTEEFYGYKQFFIKQRYVDIMSLCRRNEFNTEFIAST